MSTQVTRERRSLRQALQEAGAEPHAQLDAAFAVRTGSVSGYAGLLQVLQSFHSSADPLLTAWVVGSSRAPSVTVPDRAAALTRGLLALDIEALVPADLGGLPRDQGTGLLTDGAGLGLLYVVAGSSLGARVVLRQLPVAVPAHVRAGLGGAAGPAGAQLWRTTLAALAVTASTVVTEDATLGCRLAFAALCAASDAADVAHAG